MADKLEKVGKIWKKVKVKEVEVTKNKEDVHIRRDSKTTQKRKKRSSNDTE